jgi:hypothetical protein
VRRKYLLFGFGLVLLAVAAGAGLWLSATGIPDDPDEVILFSVDGT